MPVPMNDNIFYIPSATLDLEDNKCFHPLTDGERTKEQNSIFAIGIQV